MKHTGKAGAEPTGEKADTISGGGYSDYFAMPDYQKAAATAYAEACKAAEGGAEPWGKGRGCPKLSTWNQGGRAYPGKKFIYSLQPQGFLCC